MLITYSIQMDLKNRGMTPVVYAVQNEGVSRAIELVLKDGGASWDVPIGTVAAIRFRKSDGKGGIYDTLPNDSPAYYIEGNKVTFYLAPQVLTSEGIATAQLVLMKEKDVLCSFGIHINVEPDVSLGEQGSEDYVNLKNLMLEQIDAYFATHPDAGLSMLLLPNISGEGVVSHDVYISDFQIPPGFVPKAGDLVLHSDGYLGYIQSVDHEIDNTISVLMLSPPVSLKGKQGDRGNDGTSVTHSWDGTVLTINSASGTSHSDLKGEKGDKGDSIKGEKGDPGVAGTSVTVESVSESAVDGGSNVITFSDGKTVTIKNGKTGTPGKNGADGQPGKDGQDGKDYVLTNADKTEIAEMASELVDVPDVDVTGVVKSVNGVAPDDNGNVEIEVGGGMGGADWNASEGEPGYVQNRTHWVEVKPVEILAPCQPTYQPEYNNFVQYEGLPLVTGGKKYIVNWNGTQYECTAYQSPNGYVQIGGYYYDEVKLFEIIIADNGSSMIINPKDGTTELTISISEYGEVVHKLDPMFLPDEIGGGADWNANEGEPGYVQNRTHYIGQVKERKDIVPRTIIKDFNQRDYVWPFFEFYDFTGLNEVEVLYDGETYTCPVVEMQDGPITRWIFGNVPRETDEGDNGLPFVVMFHNSQEQFELVGSTGTLRTFNNLDRFYFRISYYEYVEKVFKLDKKFLPDDIGGADWNASEGEPGHVLNRTHWVEGGMVEILPETTLTTADAGEFSITENHPSLEVGATYTVNWNGTEYTCVGQDLSASAEGAVLVGNGGEYGVLGNNEPFALILVPGMLSFVQVVQEDEELLAELTISIYQDTTVIHKLPGKYLPDGVPWVEQGGMVEILPTTEAVADNGSFNINTKVEGVEVGKSYIVNYNGTEYKCVGQDFTMIPGAVALGDLGMMDGEPVTGEPFIFTVFPDTMFEEMGVGGQILPIDGAETVSVSLSAVDETLHGIDPRLLPDDLVRDVLVVKVATLDADFKPATASHTSGDIKHDCLLGNKAALFAIDGKTLPLIASYDSADAAEFGNIYFSNGSLLRDYVVIDYDGNITTYEMGKTVSI